MIDSLNNIADAKKEEVTATELIPAKHENSSVTDLQVPDRLSTHEDNILLKQFYSHLLATVDIIEGKLQTQIDEFQLQEAQATASKPLDQLQEKEIEHKQSLAATIRELLKIQNPAGQSMLDDFIGKKDAGRNWVNAYGAELRLIELYDEEQLEVELMRSMTEAADRLSSEHLSFYKEQLKEVRELAKKEEEKALRLKKALMYRITNDLQWYYTTRENNLYLSRKARLLTTRTLLFVMAGFLLLGALLVGVRELVSEIENLANYEWWNALLQGGFVLGAGAVGASFSMILKINDRVVQSSADELKLIHKWNYIVSRVVVGISAALIFYCLIASGFIKGDLIPEINFKAGGDTEMAISTMFKLIFFGIMAGFSERFVPDLLRKKEKVLIEER